MTRPLLVLALLLALFVPARGEERIVSLAPAITESLFALGEGGSVVGVTDFDVSPEEVLSLPRVGGYLDPSLERILALRPTLVVGTVTFHAELLRRLEELKIATLTLSLHQGLEEVGKALLSLGRSLGREERALALVEAIDTRLDELGRRVAERFGGHPPSLLVVVWTDPLTIAGGSNYLDDILDRIGVPNAAGGIVYTFPQVDREKVLALDPDIVVVARASRGMTIRSEDFIELFRGIPLRAIARGAVVELPADILFHPGPGVALAAEEIVTMIEARREP
ncbi:ABC transporter substrate-binding protein [Aminirod propionatiphilus]|uniref:ABC transporter substrate-binding protein n=1 Tax=Aminirod propionatiphilus TaxID=3415223 RepID=A0ACD1DYS9_9BACT|nr:ABC transporter substrate-binding protein [Synergistota bacterium]